MSSADRATFENLLNAAPTPQDAAVALEIISEPNSKLSDVQKWAEMGYPANVNMP
jgi:hypothetical protein